MTGRGASIGRGSRGDSKAGRAASLRHTSLAATELRVPREQLVEIQRARLLAATVTVLEERGYERTTVAHITHRAKVSRRTFYELFANREECVAALLTRTAAEVRQVLEADTPRGLPWRERVRRGLWTILCLMDREPALARVMVVHSLRGSGAVLEARERIVSELVVTIDSGPKGASGSGCSPLTPEGVVGAALAILHSRLTPAGGGSPPLVAPLLSDLMGIIVLPYQGAAVARREQARVAPVAAGTVQLPGSFALTSGDVLARLDMRMTYRTARVLEVVGRHSGASNRQIADRAGISDQGQVSKLLARLERVGLLANEGGRVKGDPNAWALTPTGALAARSIAEHIKRTDHERIVA